MKIKLIRPTADMKQQIMDYRAEFVSNGGNSTRVCAPWGI